MATMPIKMRMMRVGSIEMPVPRYGREGDSGLDLAASVRSDIWEHQPHGAPWGVTAIYDADETIYLRLEIGAAVVVPCGWAFEIPPGFEGQVRPRSGWTAKQVHVAVGTIDSNYRGEVGFCVENRTRDRIEIRTCDRLAQIIIAPVLIVAPEVVTELSTTERGAARHGSSGTR